MILFTGSIDDARAAPTNGPKPKNVRLWRANVAVDFLTYKSMIHVWADFRLFTVGLGYLE